MRQFTRITTVIWLLSICFLVGLAQDKAPVKESKVKLTKIKTVYDKAKDETLMVLMPMMVSVIPGTIDASFPAEGATMRLPSAELRMTAYFSFPGKTLITPKQIVLGFQSLTQDKTKFAQERELTVTADGSQLNFGEMTITDRRIDSGIQLRDTTFYRETLELPVAYEDFLRITKAAKVSVRLGKTNFDLQSGQLQSLRALAEKAQGG